jgi:hypothetical protein
MTTRRLGFCTILRWSDSDGLPSPFCGVTVDRLIQRRKSLFAVHHKNNVTLPNQLLPPRVHRSTIPAVKFRQFPRCNTFPRTLASERRGCHQPFNCLSNAAHSTTNQPAARERPQTTNAEHHPSLLLADWYYSLFYRILALLGNSISLVDRMTTYAPSM